MGRVKARSYHSLRYFSDLRTERKALSITVLADAVFPQTATQEAIDDANFRFLIIILLGHLILDVKIRNLIT